MSLLYWRAWERRSSVIRQIGRVSLHAFSTGRCLALDHQPESESMKEDDALLVEVSVVFNSTPCSVKFLRPCASGLSRPERRGLENGGRGMLK